MNNGDIFGFVNAVLRKEKEGSVLTPAQFNLFLKTSMWEKINSNFKRFEESQIITDSLGELRVDAETLAIDVNGEGDLSGLSETYLHVIPNPTYIYSGSVREIDIVTAGEYAHYSASASMAPDAVWPIAKIVGDTIYVNPLVSVNISFSYFKEADEPYYDYYVDANDEQVYLEVGASHVLLAGEEYVDKDDGAVRGEDYEITAEVNHSVELPFPDNERIDVAYKILQKMGIPIEKIVATEYGSFREQKEETL